MIPSSYSSNVNFHHGISYFESPNQYKSLVASRKTADTKRYDKHQIIAFMQRLHKLSPSSKPNFNKHKPRNARNNSIEEKENSSQRPKQLEDLSTNIQIEITQLRNILSNLCQEQSDLASQLQANRQIYSQLLEKLDLECMAISTQQNALCHQILDLNWTIKRNEQDM